MLPLSASSGLRLPSVLAQGGWPAGGVTCGLSYNQGSCGPPAAAHAPDPWLRVILLLLRACKTLGAQLTPSDSPSPYWCVSNRLMLAHEGWRGPAESQEEENPTQTQHVHILTQKTEAEYTHTNSGYINYPCGAKPGIQHKHTPGGVWQSHAKWIVERKRFKAFISFSVFRATASQGFDLLFSGSFLDYQRDFAEVSWLCLRCAKI